MFRTTITKRFIVIAAIISIAGCIKEYDLPVLRSSNNYLVVEGYLNASVNSPVIIQLSRTRNLTDTVTSNPELNASVMIEGEDGTINYVQSQESGSYNFNAIAFRFNSRYRVNIITEDGKRYQSDFVPIRQTPELGSLSWIKEDDGVNILLNSADPTNNTRYYRWDYTETWEYKAFVETFIGFKNGQLYFRDSMDMVYTCYDSENSDNIILGSSLKLTNDVISDQLITTIPEGSKKLSVRYSILVKQYALTESAFSYWQILRKNTQDLGSLFDAQPSQLQGNIRCISNPDEPVIGFISGGSVSEQRLFITRTQVSPWSPGEPGRPCFETRTTVDSAAFYLSSGNYSPIYYFASGGGLAFMPDYCADCRLAGGVTLKPNFW